MNLRMIGTGAIGAKERSACCLIDGKILIDCGNGNIKTIMQLGIDLGDIETIFITHLHADHFFDLPFFVLTRSFISESKHAKIFCPKDTEKIVAHLCNDYMADVPNPFNEWKEKGNIEFIEFDNLDNLEFLKDYFVTSYSVEHGDLENAYGYIIRNNENLIGFSGDSIYCSNIDKIVEKSNIAVLDMSFPKRNWMHMGVDDMEIICNKFKNKKIVATHMSASARNLAKAKNINNLIIPDDGEIIEIDLYE